MQRAASGPQPLDVAIDEKGRIAAVSPSIPAATAVRVVDLNGRLVVPGLVDAHQHLDKSRTRRAVANPTLTLAGASEGYRAFAAGVTRDDIIARAQRTVDVCLSHGTVAIRSHTNIESQTELRGIEAMIELRERCRDRMRLQVVAHLTTDAPRMLAAARTWLEAAIAAGVDAIGGVPQYADQPLAFLDMLFAQAERSGLPLDLHIDEHLDGDHVLLDALVERTRAHGMQGRVAAGHCCALSAVDTDVSRRMVAGLAEAGIAVITLPAANLFLQGRGTRSLPPRGLTRVAELLASGVRVAAASDNIQDPFIPTGSGDLLEVARWTLLAGHLGLADHRVAFDMVSANPAAIMGLDADWGIRVGARADLLITDAEDQDDLVATGATGRTVLLGGRTVAGTLDHHSWT
ncbi:MAG: amidohydrolase family protein [Hyphomicrobiales bacterium]|nr:amidohydrolase family protein [Hyphomicrobiales bacterium]